MPLQRPLSRQQSLEAESRGHNTPAKYHRHTVPGRTEGLQVQVQVPRMNVLK